jgi:sortase B
VYIKDKELHYRVFGETEYSDQHILDHYRRFRDTGDVLSFLSELKRYHTMSRQFDESVSLTPEDRILVLSTCLAQNDQQRFLVLAKLMDEISLA